MERESAKAEGGPGASDSQEEEDDDDAGEGEDNGEDEREAEASASRGAAAVSAAFEALSRAREQLGAAEGHVRTYSRSFQVSVCVYCPGTAALVCRGWLQEVTLTCLLCCLAPV